MTTGKKIAFALLGLVIGAMGGAGAGLCFGLAYTAIAGTSSFEGESGFMVVYWMLAGLVAGALAGAVLIPRFAERRSRDA